MKTLCTFRSYTKLSQWLGEVDEYPVAWLARCQVDDIPSPYSYSPSVQIYQWGSRMVIWFEVSHRVFRVFEVPKELSRFDTDDRATDWHIQFRRKVA